MSLIKLNADTQIKGTLSGQTISTNTTVTSNSYIEEGNPVTINNGITLTFSGVLSAGAYKIFNCVGTGNVKFNSLNTPVVHPEWWGLLANADSTYSTTNTAALVAANASFVDSNVTLKLGGTIQLPQGNIYIDNWLFTGGDRVVKGHGQYATRLIGVGAGDYTMEIFNSGRCRFEDFQVDGNSVKLRALQIACTIGTSVGAMSFLGMSFVGATTDGVYMFGGPPGIYDISCIAFFNCQFINQAASNSQIYMSGDNTIAISFYTCNIYGASPLGVYSGGACSFFDCNFASNSSWNIQASSGQVKSYGCHSEGTGGFLNTLSSDPSILASSSHSIVNHAGSNTGVNTGGMAIKHEAFRYLHIADSFFNENIEIDSGVFGQGVLDVWNNTFEAGSGYVLTEGNIQGAHNGGVIQKNNTPIRWQVQPDSVALLGTDYVTALNNNIITLSSSADVVGTLKGSFFIVQAVSFSGTAIVFSQGGATPVIVQQIGAIFVTGAPAAGEVQIKDSGVGLGVSFRAGSGKNGEVISLTAMSAR